jgi:hypothetical protein
VPTGASAGVARRLFAAASAAALLTIAGAGVTQATVTQQGTLRVAFAGGLSPDRLPRTGLAPVAVSLSGDISTTDHSTPPQLERITMAINRHGRLNPAGLPRCRYHQIQPASSVEARRACRSSLVGSGSFRANVALPDQSPFPSNGRVLAFNGVLHGKPVIYAHIFGTKPVPISQTTPFHIHRIAGTYRVVLSAQLPRVAAAWGYVSGLSLTLWRTYRFHGHVHSYLSAGCPAPKGFPGAVFPFARASFGFDDGSTLRSSLTRSCKVRP